MSAGGKCCARDRRKMSAGPHYRSINLPDVHFALLFVLPNDHANEQTAAILSPPLEEALPSYRNLRPDNLSGRRSEHPSSGEFLPRGYRLTPGQLPLLQWHGRTPEAR